MQKLSTTEIAKAFRESGLNDKQINEASTSFLATYGNYPTKEALESFIEGYLFNLRMMGMISDNATVEAEAAKENSNGKEHDVIVITHPDVIKANGNKEFATYGAAKCISHFEGTTIDEWNNYILKRGCKKAIIDFLEDSKKSFPDGKVSNEKRIQRDFKKLIESDVPVVRVEEFNGKKYYKLLNCVMVDSKPNYFVRIPLQQMRELVVISNGNMLRLYALVCSILQAKKCGYDKYHPITRKYLAECLGYSTNTDDAAKTIGTMLTALCNLGHLERLEETRISDNGNTYKTVYKYRRTTLAEWQEAKNRGTIKK